MKDFTTLNAETFTAGSGPLPQEATCQLCEAKIAFDNRGLLLFNRRVLKDSQNFL
jgi:hypothetical protein